MSREIFEKLPDKIGFFGLGKSNTDILKRLKSDKRIVLRSDGKIGVIPKIEAQIAGIYEGESAFLNPFEEILFLSPSVRRDRRELLEFKRKGIRLYSDFEMFFANVTVPVFAVSGSDGKSTTSTLASLLLQERFINCPLIGNSGTPMAGSISEDNKAYVTELSSFMLSYGRYGFFRGALTCVNENHLNWHKDFREYKAAKLSILQRAKEAIAPADDPVGAEYLESNSVYGIFSYEQSYPDLRERYRAQVFYTCEDGYILRSGERILSLDQIKRKESYNVKNLLCALTLTDGYVTREIIKDVAREFKGLVHRAELFYSFRGIDFIDSSIDSSPERTKQTLTSLNRRVVLILGGRGKGLSYSSLTECVSKYAKAVLLAGENAQEIAKALPRETKTYLCKDLYSAIELSKNILEDNDALLLSPASTSYDAFDDFTERGIFFKNTVKKIFN